MKLKKINGIKYFTGSELVLWLGSAALILAAFLIFDRGNYLTLAASMIGVTSLIFCAKGNPFGQLLMVAFSVFYGIISYRLAYYGEMLTYMGMTAPMAVFSLIAWLRNPYEGKRSQVRVNRLKPIEIIPIVILAFAVTVIFYHILKAFNTSRLILSTISVTTSFIAVYLTFRRSAFYAIGYAVNDIVLIILWAAAAAEDISYISVLCCFVVFLANDIYGYINWSKIRRRQEFSV